MSRGAIVAAALFVTGVTTASAAETVFWGTIKITAVSAQCQKVHVGDNEQSQFHPKMAGNANFAGLSWVFRYGARGHALNGRNFDASFRTVQTGGVGWGDAYTVPPAQNAQIRITSYTPAIGSITATTAYVILQGQIKQPFSDPGGLNCTASFIGSYVKGNE